VPPGQPQALSRHGSSSSRTRPLSDPARGRLWHEQRIARASHGLAGAAEGDTDVWLDGWRFRRHDGGYTARVAGEQLTLELALKPTQPPMPNGEGGYSRKGRDPGSASYYYSLPHLAVTGEVAREGRRVAVTARPGSTRNGPRRCSTAKPPAGTGSGSTSTTVAR